MILTCPRCATRFDVDPGALGDAGRRVRCSACKHVWFAEPPEDAPRLVIDETEPLSASYAPLPERRRASRPFAWFFALFLALAAAVLLGRDAIVAAVPRAADLYRLLRLPGADVRGLEVREVASTRLYEAGVSVLVVEGAVVNPSGGEVEVPPVRVTLLGEGGRELTDGTARPEAVSLPAGGRTRFVVRLIDPPQEAATFSVALTGEEG